MVRILSKISFAFLVVILTAVIMYLLMVTGAFNLLPPDNPQTSAILEYSMDLLSKQLMSMVPEADEKQKVAEAFEQFKRKVYNYEVSEAQLEKVTANILNANHQDSALSFSEVDAILAIASPPATPKRPPVPDKAIVVSSNNSEFSGHKFTFSVDGSSAGNRIRVQGKIVQPHLNRTAHKISEIIEFDQELKKVIDNKIKKQPHVRYVFQNGLTMRIDPKLRVMLPDYQSKKLEEKLHKLENQEIIIWEREIPKEMEILKVESERLNQESQAILNRSKQLQMRIEAKAAVLADTIRIDSIRQPPISLKNIPQPEPPPQTRKPGKLANF